MRPQNLLTLRRARSLALSCAMLGVAMTGCAQVTGGGSWLGGRGAQRDDVALLPHFTGIVGIAVGRRFVFVLSPAGLAMYDRTGAQWLAPLTGSDVESLFSARDRVPAIAADPTGDAVWIGGAGTLLHYDAAIDLHTRAVVPGDVELIAFDGRDLGGGALVRTTAGWLRASSGGFVRPLGAGELPPADALVRPPTYAELVRDYPALASVELLVARDAHLRQWPVSAAARDPDRSEAWLGTWGNGVFRVDLLFGTGEHRPFGLSSSRAAALDVADGGVWAATDAGAASLSGQPERGGLTFASDDLRSWRWVTGGSYGVPETARVTDLVVRDRVAWLATDRGLFTLGLEEGGDRVRAASRDLSSDPVLSLASRGDVVWAGTVRGAVMLDLSAERSGGGPAVPDDIVARGIPVHDLLFTGDSLWLATDAGLLLLPRARVPQSQRVSVAAAEPRLDGRIRALAAHDSVLVAALERDIIELRRGSVDIRTRRLTIDGGSVGGITALAIDGGSLWIGGPFGVQVHDRTTGLKRALRVPTDLPGAVRDIALSDRVAWIATDAGLVRVRRLVDSSIQ